MNEPRTWGGPARPGHRGAAALRAAASIAVASALVLSAACGPSRTDGGAAGVAATGVVEELGVPAYMVKGDLAAPVTLFEWSDYECPYCARHAAGAGLQIQEAYVESGQVRIVFRDLPLISIHAHAVKAAEAARCAGELGGSDGYWDMHHRLFESQAEWSAQAEAVPFFKTYAGRLGLDQTAFDTCLDDGRHGDAVMADYNEALGLGIRATPSFVLQDTILEGALPFGDFQAKLDVVVGGGVLPTATPPPTPELVEIEAPDAVVEIGDAPVKGSEDAPVTIIEFSDYECPYCKMFVDNTYATLMSEYVETGRVRYAFRDLPLKSIHPMAVTAARAAHCARDQGGDDAYFGMHDALFADQERWALAAEVQGPGDPPASLAGPLFNQMASGLGLDGDALEACLAAGAHEELVEASLQQAVTELNLGGAPTFIINGQVIAGAMSPEMLADYVAKAERGERLTLVLPKEYAERLATPVPPKPEE